METIVEYVVDYDREDPARGQRNEISGGEFVCEEEAKLVVALLQTFPNVIRTEITMRTTQESWTPIYKKIVSEQSMEIWNRGKFWMYVNSASNLTEARKQAQANANHSGVPWTVFTDISGNLHVCCQSQAPANTFGAFKEIVPPQET